MGSPVLTKKEDLKCVLVTDCGSTTTKALLFEKQENGWHQTWRGEAPTTVEEPVADVTVGALNSFAEIQEISGRRILSPEASGAAPFMERAADAAQGIDLYLSTSSAGGGLQMMVAGVVRQMTAESAQRAALGAGAIVLDVISADDGREDHERIERIRRLRPDIVLLTGGVDGGSQTHVLEMAETLLAAAPRPRFGGTLKLPVIYAGNQEAAGEVKAVLDKMAQVKVVANVRPSLEDEQLGPAREAIHEFFLGHVMSHSPGYHQLLAWSPLPILPTPAAVGVIIKSFALKHRKQVLCADIGGATTDMFSVCSASTGELVFNRTVSANYGMSYSIANVLVEAGAAQIARWLPYEISDTELRDRLRNKMIRPTSIPHTLEELWLEQAVCREALRLALEHHRSLAVGLSGLRTQRSISDIFTQKSNRYELVNLFTLDLVIGSGGVLSHAPNRLAAALMMLDGFGLCGLTELAVDSVFMLPHLGVFAGVHPEAASEIFLRDCLVRIAHSIVPVFNAVKLRETTLAEVFVGGRLVGIIKRGEICRIPREAADAAVEIKILPKKGVDVGAGAGVELVRQIQLNEFGLILDGRNRPIEFPEDRGVRLRSQEQAYRNLGLM